jgi:hypothetical protein
MPIPGAYFTPKLQTPGFVVRTKDLSRAHTAEVFLCGPAGNCLGSLFVDAHDCGKNTHIIWLKKCMLWR